MVIVPGQQCDASGAAQRRGVESIVFQAAARELLERRHMDRAAEGAAVPEPDVVDEDDHHIRCAVGSLDVVARRRFRVARVEGRDRFGLRLVNRQHGAIELDRLPELVGGDTAADHRHGGKSN
jgi:hypothetical protein